MAKTDKSELQLDELESQIQELTRKRQEILQQNRAQALESVRAEVQRYGFTAVELGLSSPLPTPRKPQQKSSLDIPSGTVLVNPADGSTYQRGKVRGRPPTWFSEFIKAGGDWRTLVKA